jgi:hypothetical protein
MEDVKNHRGRLTNSTSGKKRCGNRTNEGSYSRMGLSDSSSSTAAE